MDSYQAQWAKYRRMSYYTIGIAVCFPFVVLTTAYIAALQQSLLLGLAVFLIWGVVFMVVGNRCARFPCPRCGRPFATTPGHTQGFFARACVHCGLPKNAPQPGQ